LHILGGEAAVRRARYGLGIASALLTGCLAGSRQGSQRSESPSVPSVPSVPGAGGLQVPGSYVSGGSCGQQWGDEVVLTLLPSRVFSLRQTYRDRNCAHQITLVYLGRWSLAADGHQLRLDNGPVWLRRLTILDGRTLRIPERPEAEPPPRTVVQTVSRLVPFRDPFHLRGLGSSSVTLQ
jgi:hypothetical protein